MFARSLVKRKRETGGEGETQMYRRKQTDRLTQSKHVEKDQSSSISNNYVL